MSNNTIGNGYSYGYRYNCTGKPFEDTWTIIFERLIRIEGCQSKAARKIQQMACTTSKRLEKVYCKSILARMIEVTINALNHFPRPDLNLNFIQYRCKSICSDLFGESFYNYIIGKAKFIEGVFRYLENELQYIEAGPVNLLKELFHWEKLEKKQIKYVIRLMHGIKTYLKQKKQDEEKLINLFWFIYDLFNKCFVLLPLSSEENHLESIEYLHDLISLFIIQMGKTNLSLNRRFGEGGCQYSLIAKCRALIELKQSYYNMTMDNNHKKGITGPIIQEDIPKEIYWLILSKLNDKEKGRLGLTCKDFLVLNSRSKFFGYLPGPKTSEIVLQRVCLRDWFNFMIVALENYDSQCALRLESMCREKWGDQWFSLVRKDQSDYPCHFILTTLKVAIARHYNNHVTLTFLKNDRLLIELGWRLLDQIIDNDLSSKKAFQITKYLIDFNIACDALIETVKVNYYLEKIFALKILSIDSEYFDDDFMQSLMKFFFKATNSRMTNLIIEKAKADKKWSDCFKSHIIETCETDHSYILYLAELYFKDDFFKNIYDFNKNYNVVIVSIIIRFLGGESFPEYKNENNISIECYILIIKHIISLTPNFAFSYLYTVNRNDFLRSLLKLCLADKEFEDMALNALDKSMIWYILSKFTLPYKHNKYEEDDSGIQDPFLIDLLKFFNKIIVKKKQKALKFLGFKCKISNFLAYIDGQLKPIIWLCLFKKDFWRMLSKDFYYLIIKEIMTQLKELSYEKERLDINDLKGLLMEIMEEQEVDSQCFLLIRKLLMDEQFIKECKDLRIFKRINDYIAYRESWLSKYMTLEVWLALWRIMRA